jgi:hypothetical protein
VFLNVLPDPNYLINDAGIEDPSGVAGPGFVTLSMNLSFPSFKPDTIGGRTIMSSNTRAYWQATLNYNPLTAEQFAPVGNFVLEKKGSRKPFYVSMPQYKAPKDPTFATFVETADITADIAETAGSKSLEITESAWSSDTYASGLPKTGDVFTIDDPDDSLHKQAYMVSHVDNHLIYDTLPSNGNIRIHFFPGLQRDTPVGATIQFNNPLFSMNLINDVEEYSLDTDGLYSYSLKLEEALY